jgi:hypothetical protein
VGAEVFDSDPVPRQNLCLAKTPSGISCRQTPGVLTVKSSPHFTPDNILVRHNTEVRLINQSL